MSHKATVSKVRTVRQTPYTGTHKQHVDYINLQSVTESISSLII